MSKEKRGRFKPISDYWFSTFRELNPFVGNAAVCDVCKERAVKERRWWLEGKPISMNEFECPNKHRWIYKKVHD